VDPAFDPGELLLRGRRRVGEAELDRPGDQGAEEGVEIVVLALA
jgi:hypothetical protein